MFFHKFGSKQVSLISDVQSSVDCWWPEALCLLSVVTIYSFLAVFVNVVFPENKLVSICRCSVLITVCVFIKSLQGPSFLPTGKGSQMAKKTLSNIINAKIIKVHSVPLRLVQYSKDLELVLSPAADF